MLVIADALGLNSSQTERRHSARHMGSGVARWGRFDTGRLGTEPERRGAGYRGIALRLPTLADRQNVAHDLKGVPAPWPARKQHRNLGRNGHTLCEGNGERGRTRTCDPCLKRALLYQLSYAPTLLQNPITQQIVQPQRRFLLRLTHDTSIGIATANRRRSSKQARGETIALR